MDKKEIGRFKAISFDDKVHEFIVNEDDSISFPEIGEFSFDRMILKPRFQLYCLYLKRGYVGEYISNAPHDKIDGLIREYVIDDELFDYLLERGIILYSSDMAYYYGFKEKEGYDRKDSAGFFKFKGRPFKWAAKKVPVLVKQKQGQFN